MTAQNKSTIKSYFETGDKPTQAQFEDFIDSYQDAAANLGTLSSASIGAFGLQVLALSTSAQATNLLFPVDDSTAIAKGSVDPTKRIRFEVDGLTAGQTRAYSTPDYDGLMAVTSGAAYQVGDLLYAETTSKLARIAAVALGQKLYSAGVNTAPTWGQGVKVVTFNWDLSTTGSQSVTGAGFTPTLCFIVGGVGGSSKYQLFGVTDGTTSFAVANNHANVAGTNDGNASLGFIVQSGTTNTLVFTSFDSDGITFNKAKTGSPTGTANMVAVFIR